MSKITYARSPSEGEHWITEVGDLEPGNGLWWYRGHHPELAVAGDYYSRFIPKIADAGPALAAAYPDKKFDVAQHGSAFYVRRV